MDFEIPPDAQRGTMSTIEGVLERAAENLELLQPERLRLGDVDNFHRCREVIYKLHTFSGNKPANLDDDDNDDKAKAPDEFEPFEIILDDPAGNSYIENPSAPSADPQLVTVNYFRSPTQDMSLGLQPSKEAVESGTIDNANPTHKNVVNVAKGGISMDIDQKKDKNGQPAPISFDNPLGNTPIGRQEVMKFPTKCSNCQQECETDMCITDIPHFKEVIIMALFCEKCGYKSNEIKGGGAIPKFGTKITLRITSEDDLAREILKSDTAGIAIPELELELDEGGLDGVYTTVEGLLEKLHDRLTKANPFGSGDSATKQHTSNDGGAFSAPSPTYVRYQEFLTKLKGLSQGERLPFTLLISDPLSNSFVGPIPKIAIDLALQSEREDSHDCYRNFIDEGMDVDEYERSHDQNEYLGLNDIKTENYAKHDTDANKGNDNYGTDIAQDLPDRLRRLDHRGPDHPHQVGKAPVEGDNTIMGAGSANFAIPAMEQRGKAKTADATDAVTSAAAKGADGEHIKKLIAQFESNDDAFISNKTFDGHKEGMVFKSGEKGVGYYTDYGSLDKIVN
uniref:Zinc finger ZPR1-type domain-containing protein n=1 Tax=Attheya septentrionalis TaxID=420275 RepID=A0A7S2UQT0_9STRA